MNPREYAVDVPLRDGTRIHIRALRPDDKARLVAFFGRLSPESIYFRFCGTKTGLSAQELTYLTELDFDRRAALVATLGRAGVEHVVGVARYAVPPDHGGAAAPRAEFAVAVEDAVQNRGIGTLLLEHLLRVAKACGVHEFEAYALPGNDRLLKLVREGGRPVRQSLEHGMLHLSF